MTLQSLTKLNFLCCLGYFFRDFQLYAAILFFNFFVSFFSRFYCDHSTVDKRDIYKRVFCINFTMIDKIISHKFETCSTPFLTCIFLCLSMLPGLAFLTDISAVRLNILKNFVATESKYATLCILNISGNGNMLILVLTKVDSFNW